MELQPRAKANLNGETIVLTDSEDEEYVRRPHFRDRAPPAGDVGPSRKKQPTPLLQHKNDASSGSLGNIPTPKRRPKSKSLPLFLPSDEENEPPDLDDLEKLGGDAIVVDNFPSPPPDPIPGYVAQVLEIIPDVDPDHAFSLVQQNFPEFQERVLETVLHALFEDPIYPKADKKGKRKHVEENEQGDARGKPKTKVDYGSHEREYNGGVHYPDLCIEQLMLDFPYIPKAHIRNALLAHNSFYAATHLFLADEQRRGDLQYIPKKMPWRAAGKGKRKALYDAEFEKEREWIALERQEEPEEKVQAIEEDEECEDGIECGCCFSMYPFDKMVQCPDAHLFCSSCMTSYAETLLGSHDHKIVCMDQSGCKLPFPDTELIRFLTPKLMALYERVKQTKEVEAAGLEGLEECPFCEYKCVIENEQEKLFTCRNEEGGCAVVSCRQCKKLDHLPKSCKEMEEDKHLDGRHTIEEAMTRALMRNCPKCQKAFIKEQGCNKMTCPNCMSLSCYICRKLITGYEHFAQQPGHPALASTSKGKCVLWDAVEQRHADEAKAAKKALKEYKRANPDVDEANLKVELPVAPPAPAPAAVGGLQLPYGHQFANMQAAMANARGWMLQMQYAQAPALPPAPVVRHPVPVFQPPVPIVQPPRRRAAKRTRR
ncbi:hypothetical protein B0H10DRAFT_1786528 [Mycena sp. CBHHK59/15]|nr:hypothetical protein B0H10DRAFT_1786528 [Mycena sp. CBHHK59/15]